MASLTDSSGTNLVTPTNVMSWGFRPAERQAEAISSRKRAKFSLIMFHKVSQKIWSVKQLGALLDGRLEKNSRMKLLGRAQKLLDFSDQLFELERL